MRIGVYPGSFNPPTIAHLAVAEAALDQCGLDRVELLISRRPLGKERGDLPNIDDRLAVLHRLAAERPWLAAGATEHQLIADIARGYDVVIVGADKWAQVVDPAWYGGSAGQRDRAVERLPVVAVAPRPPAPLPTPGPRVVLLALDELFHPVSSTAAREGRSEWRVPVVGELPLEDVGE